MPDIPAEAVQAAAETVARAIWGEEECAENPELLKVSRSALEAAARRTGTMADDLQTSDPTLPCLVCGKPLKSVLRSPDVNQPMDATSFTARGQYGSTAFDPMDGTLLQINVCDLCLLERRDRVSHIDRDGNPRSWDVDEEEAGRA